MIKIGDIFEVTGYDVPVSFVLSNPLPVGATYICISKRFVDIHTCGSLPPVRPRERVVYVGLSMLDDRNHTFSMPMRLLNEAIRNDHVNVTGYDRAEAEKRKGFGTVRDAIIDVSCEASQAVNSFENGDCDVSILTLKNLLKTVKKAARKVRRYQ